MSVFAVTVLLATLFAVAVNFPRVTLFSLSVTVPSSAIDHLLDVTDNLVLSTLPSASSSTPSTLTPVLLR